MSNNTRVVLILKMNANQTIYNGNKTFGLPAFFIPLLLLPALLDSRANFEGRVIGFLGFFILCLLIAVIPMLLSVEITDDTVTTKIGNLTMKQIEKKDVINLVYDKIFKGGLGVGKGLHIFTSKNGKQQRITIGASLYGTEAIKHAQRVLSK